MAAKALGVAGKVEKGQMQCGGKPVWAAEEWQDIAA